MNPVLLATLRRNWRLVGAIAAFVIFTFIHFAFFRPAAARYRAALVRAGGLEAVLDPNGGRPPLPPRVFSLITDNSLLPQDAQERGGSGALGVILIESLGRIASRSGLTVVSSEPQPVTQEPLTTQVRAHLHMRGRYREIVGFFGALSESPELLLVERFLITPGDGENDDLEVWISRLYMKQTGGKS
jgi:hypothetical protein